MSKYSTVENLLDGLPVVEDDHVFAPVGRLSQRVIQLMNERANLLEPKGEEDGPADERALGESYSDRRDVLDEQILEALADEHPDAPRVRLRGLSDEDYVAARAEVDALDEEREKKKQPALTRDGIVVETNLRYIARAFVEPKIDVEKARDMRRKLNQGEYGRLLDHISTLGRAHAEQATLPNS